MAKLRKAISIPAHEVEILKELYRQFRIPSDQYKRRPAQLDRFVGAWNTLTHRNDSGGELLHYIITQRKQKKWVTFGNDYARLACLPDTFLSAREWLILEAIYREEMLPREIGSDNLAYDDLLAAQIAREFCDRSGRMVYGRLLFSAIMAKRKRGEWVNVRPPKENQGGIGFSDMDDIAV